MDFAQETEVKEVGTPNAGEGSSPSEEGTQQTSETASVSAEEGAGAGEGEELPKDVQGLMKEVKRLREVNREAKTFLEQYPEAKELMEEDPRYLEYVLKQKNNVAENIKASLLIAAQLPTHPFHEVAKRVDWTTWKLKMDEKKDDPDFDPDDPIQVLKKENLELRDMLTTAIKKIDGIEGQTIASTIEQKRAQYKDGVWSKVPSNNDLNEQARADYEMLISSFFQSNMSVAEASKRIQRMIDASQQLLKKKKVDAGKARVAGPGTSESLKGKEPVGWDAIIAHAKEKFGTSG